MPAESRAREPHPVTLPTTWAATTGTRATHLCGEPPPLATSSRRGHSAGALLPGTEHRPRASSCHLHLLSSCGNTVIPSFASQPQPEGEDLKRCSCTKQPSSSSSSFYFLFSYFIQSRSRVSPAAEVPGKSPTQTRISCILSKRADGIAHATQARGRHCWRPSLEAWRLCSLPRSRPGLRSQPCPRSHIYI